MKVGRRIPGWREHVAALDGRPFHALEVDRGALAGHGVGHGLAVGLDAAHLGLELAWGRPRRARPGRRVPAVSVPVTTVPNPLIVKTRSIGRRKVASVPRGRHRRARARRARARSSSSPSPVFAETGTIGAPSRKRPARTARDVLLDQLEPLRLDQVAPWSARRGRSLTRSSWQIARCSRVWGMTPSSAAMTSMTRSIPPTPASMFLTKRSWPGTSTMPTVRPSRSVEVGEAEVDGDPALLLLLQAVGVDAGQGLDQRGLAVVDVARRCRRRHVL